MEGDPLNEPAARRTPLYDLHVAAGARMVPFAGWEMPLQYTGVIEEHLAVRQKAGLFDVSHMGEVAIRGREALSFLQLVTCNDAAKLVAGRAQYTALMTPEGTFVDDLLIYMLGDRDYLLVVNAANTGKDLATLLYHAKGMEVSVEDVSSSWGQIALQGQKALAILQPLTSARLGELKYYGFERAEVAGVPSLVSRTGYTGEDGFEVYAPMSETPQVWQAILEAGRSSGLVPVGLAARDTLRLEAKMALYGNDIDETTTVLEADLGWIVKLEKGDFVGRDVLERQRAEGLSRKLVGFEMEGRAIARHGYPAAIDGRPAGTVTSGTHAPFLRKSIGLAYLPSGTWEPGSRFEVEIRGRLEPARVVPTPFYKRSR
jgi:aminomethyltransferase